MRKKKRKYVVWLNNTTDRRDDEWVVVWAYSRSLALKEAEWDTSRFSRGHVMTATEFRNENGFGA